jgi:hypothetical protein
MQGDGCRAAVDDKYMEYYLHMQLTCDGHNTRNIPPLPPIPPHPHTDTHTHTHLYAVHDIACSYMLSFVPYGTLADGGQPNGPV